MSLARDPDEMSPDARVAEVAAILAAGYLRQRQCASKPASPAHKPLDCADAQRPSLNGRLTDREPVHEETGE
jgi:hypothetical protein